MKRPAGERLRQPGRVAIVYSHADEGREIQRHIDFLKTRGNLLNDLEFLDLDEPSAGMNRQKKEDLARFILRIKYEIGITMIWVEHDTRYVVKQVVKHFERQGNVSSNESETNSHNVIFVFTFGMMIDLGYRKAKYEQR